MASDVPFGADTLSLPCYVTAGDNDVGLTAWKLEHPDWFTAGVWRGRSQRGGRPSHAQRERTIRWMSRARASNLAQPAGGALEPGWAASVLRDVYAIGRRV